MKKWFPLLLVILSMSVFTGLIVKNEYHLKNSQSIYVQLRPVDPRSLIQGDYMALNYQLYYAPQNTDSANTDFSAMDALAESARAEEVIFSGHYYDQRIKNQSSVLSYVELDSQRRVIHTYFDPQKEKKTFKLVLKNPSNRTDSLYPASKSFLFSEGLATCYQQAQYAEFKVDSQGNAILASLRGGALQELNCEKRQRWINGNLPLFINKG